MKPKQLTDRELARVTGGAWAVDSYGHVTHPGKRHTPGHIAYHPKPPRDAGGGIIPPPPPPEPPSWKLLGRIR